MATPRLATPRLTDLPSEVLLLIAEISLLPDQAALARTCRTFNVFLTPMVWSDIELHHRGVHEGLDIDDLEGLEEQFEISEEDWEKYAKEGLPHARVVLETSRRKHAQPVPYKQWEDSLEDRRDRRKRTPRASDNCNRSDHQNGREELFIKVKSLTSPARWTELAGHVRSLCFSIGIDEEVIEALASLRNLSSLELVGLPIRKPRPSEWYAKDTSPAIAPFKIEYPNLENLKLRGYFPAAFARAICSSSTNITHLNLGLLAAARDDKPHKDGLLERREWADGPTYDSDDADDSDDSNDEERTSWAFHSPIWLYPEVLPPLSLPKLTHLHLVKPFRGDLRNIFQDSFEHVPMEYERIMSSEWAALLRSCAGTLKELVLDHRIPMEAGDTVGDGDPTSERLGSRAIDGDFTFCHKVLSVLIKESESFRNLQRLDMRGMRIRGAPLNREGGLGDNEDEEEDEDIPDNEDLLRSTYPNCEIEIYNDPYPIYVYGGWVFQSWPMDYHEAMLDAGDGLLYNCSYYNDYVKRFGRQWKIEG